VKLDRSLVVLRPRTVAEVLDLACLLCCSLGLRLYARLGAAVLLPGWGLCLVLRYALGWGWLGVWLIALGYATLAQGVFTVAAGQLIFAERLTAREVLGALRGRWGSYLGAMLLSRFVIALSSLTLLLLPLAWIRAMFVPEASLLEGAGAGTASTRAAQLIYGRSSDAFVALMGMLLSQAAFVLVAELLGHGLLGTVLQVGRPFGSLFGDGGSPSALLGLLLAVPFVATARFLQYIDMRTRTDGWDIQLRFMALSARERQKPFGRLAA